MNTAGGIPRDRLSEAESGLWLICEAAAAYVLAFWMPLVAAGDSKNATRDSIARESVTHRRQRTVNVRPFAQVVQEVFTGVPIVQGFELLPTLSAASCG